MGRPSKKRFCPHCGECLNPGRIITCEHCGKVAPAKRSTKRFCNNVCRAMASKARLDRERIADGTDDR